MVDNMVNTYYTNSTYPEGIFFFKDKTNKYYQKNVFTNC